MHQVKLFTWIDDLNHWLQEASTQGIEIKGIYPMGDSYMVHYYEPIGRML